MAQLRVYIPHPTLEFFHHFIRNKFTQVIRGNSVSPYVYSLTAGKDGRKSPTNLRSLTKRRQSLVNTKKYNKRSC